MPDLRSIWKIEDLIYAGLTAMIIDYSEYSQAIVPKNGY